MKNFFFLLLSLLIVYSVLPSEFRFSRAILILGASVSSVALFLIDEALDRRLSSRYGKRIRTAIVGLKQSSDRLLALLDRKSNIEFVGFITPGDQDRLPDSLGPLDTVESICRFHRIDELIFHQQDVPARDIMGVMTTLGSQYRMKIYASGSESIVGSWSKNDQGEIDAPEIVYQITSSHNRFLKRSFDLFMGVFVLLISPLLWPFNRFTWNFWMNLLAVLSGRKTWVGYHSTRSINSPLPLLKPVVIQWPGRHDVGRSEERQRYMNFIYAREYSIWMDVEAFLKGLLHLGE